MCLRARALSTAHVFNDAFSSRSITRTLFRSRTPPGGIHYTELASCVQFTPLIRRRVNTSSTCPRAQIQKCERMPRRRSFCMSSRASSTES